MIYKDDFIVDTCKEKRVLHIGDAASPSHVEKAKKNKLVHQRLAKVTKELIGLDCDKKAINELKEYNIKNIYYGDILLEKYDENILKKSYDVIIFGDVIEHLDNPGIALKNIKRFMGKKTTLIVTAPNAWSIFRIFNHFKKKEAVHPEHMFWPSKVTMDNIIHKNGYSIKEFNFFLYRSKKDNRSLK